MAKGKGTKSEAIRDMLRANRTKGPKEISQLLKEQKGLTVDPQYVSVIKSSMRRGRKKRGLKTGPSARDGLVAVGAAVEFVKAAGGIDAAKAALGTIEKIGKVVN